MKLRDIDTYLGRLTIEPDLVLVLSGQRNGKRAVRSAGVNWMKVT